MIELDIQHLLLFYYFRMVYLKVAQTSAFIFFNWSSLKIFFSQKFPIFVIILKRAFAC